MKKVVEVMGTVDKQGQLFLDNPLSVKEDTRVKVIVLVSEKEDEEFKKMLENGDLRLFRMVANKKDSGPGGMSDW